MIIELDSNRLKEVQKNLKKLQGSMDDVYRVFRIKSCEWIKNKAIDYLDSSINEGYDIVTKIRDDTSWVVDEIDNNTTRLYNNQEVARYVEFGTGLVGSHDPHPEAVKTGYKYNHKTKAKDEYGYWTFLLPDGRPITFQGYVGKAFLYNAFMEYVNSKIYVSKFNEAYKEVIGGKL